MSNPVLEILQQQLKKAAGAPAHNAEAVDGAGAAPAHNAEAVGGAGAAPVEKVIYETSFPSGMLAGAKAFEYSQKHGLPSPFVNRGRGPYIIIGHGVEELVAFDERPLVPPGVTLVTNVLAGVVSLMPQTCGMMNMLSREENRAMVSNPVDARFNMKRMLVEDHVEHLHVYTEGQRMPNLKVTLLGNFSHSIKKEVGGKQKEVHYNKIFRSGVHEFPLKPYEGEDEIHISRRLTNIASNNVRTKNIGYTRGHDRKCLQFVKRFSDSALNIDELHEIYKDSLHPTSEYLTSIVDQIKTKNISVQRLSHLLGEIPLTDIFTHNGPGVYYFIACRADKSEYEDVHFQNLIQELSCILHPDWLYYTNNDGEEKEANPEAFYKEFRISPYDIDFIRELLDFIGYVRGRLPIDVETQKLLVRQRLEDIPDSVQRALHSPKYFSEFFVDEFIRFVDRTSVPKQLIRTASLRQQIRAAGDGGGGGSGGGGGGGGANMDGGGAPRRRTRVQRRGKSGRRASLKKRNRN